MNRANLFKSKYSKKKVSAMTSMSFNFKVENAF